VVLDCDHLCIRGAKRLSTVARSAG